MKNSFLLKILIKETDEDYCHLESLLAIHKFCDIEELVEVFEFVISPEEKVITGAVYTPNYIREFIVNNSIEKTVEIDESFRVCDPACGCSGFLYTAAKRIKEISGRSYSEIYRENLFGLDIQDFSINRSKLLLSLAAIVDGEDSESFDFNFHLGNALNFDWSTNIEGFMGFDTIVGNPPYVCSRNIEKASKHLIQNWSVSSSGHPDLYIPFFEIGISNLKPNATLGYITMNTFFKSQNGRALREYFQRKRFSLEILDFGSFQVFQSKSTYTCICLIKNTMSDTMKYVRLPDSTSLLSQGIAFRTIEYKDLDSKAGWNLQERDILTKIEQTGTRLGESFTSRNGIATLKNDIYIFEPVSENEQFFILESEEQYSIEREVCRDIVNPNKLTQVDTIDGLRKKIIFPYQFVNGQPRIIPETEFIQRFPNAYNYLLCKKEILSTRDKGAGKDYNPWYTYGRNQSLEHYQFKLLFPHIAPSTPNFVLNSDPELLFVNGMGIVGENKRELQLIRKVMSSRLFWFYITNSSKPYGSGYYSLSRNYIKNFGVFDFSEEQITELIEMECEADIDEYLENLYDIDLSGITSEDISQHPVLAGIAAV
ncbi:MAG: N-6 DNA methylase [Imperialibacter sp.]